MKFFENSWTPQKEKVVDADGNSKEKNVTVETGNAWEKLQEVGEYKKNDAWRRDSDEAKVKYKKGDPWGRNLSEKKFEGNTWTKLQKTGEYEYGDPWKRTIERNQNMKLKNGKVKFIYDNKGEIVGAKFDDVYDPEFKQQDLVGGDIKNLILNAELPGYDEKKFVEKKDKQNAAYADSMKTNSRMKNLLGMHKELNKKGFEKESQAVLKEIYRLADEGDSKVGLKIFDRTKFPPLEE